MKNNQKNKTKKKKNTSRNKEPPVGIELDQGRDFIVPKVI